MMDGLKTISHLTQNKYIQKRANHMVNNLEYCQMPALKGICVWSVHE